MMRDILAFGRNLFGNTRTQEDWVGVTEEYNAPIAGEEPAVLADKKRLLTNPYYAFAASHFGALSQKSIAL